MKIVTVLGARPQFIKAAAVSREFLKRPGLQEVIVHTGQHYDASMSQVFFDQLQIPEPEYNLGVGSGDHAQMTAQMIKKLGPVINDEAPDGVLVYGDTNSTLAGALVAAKLNIAVFHVEAGLRSYNRNMPEEVNRVLTDHVSTLLFCPSVVSKKNLAKEGINSGVHVSGDVMFDIALAQMANHAPYDGQPFALFTCHRAENTDSKASLESILAAVNHLSKDIEVRFPTHPRTRKMIEQHGLADYMVDLKVLDPVDYASSLELIRNASLLITDSGGMQKEAYFVRTPCLTIREETEWTETLDAGANFLCRAQKDEIYSMATRILSESFGDAVFSRDLFGDGLAAKNIADELLHYHENSLTNQR